MPCLPGSSPAAAILPSIPRSPKPPGIDDAVEITQATGREQPLDVLGLDPCDLDHCAVVEAAVLGASTTER